MRRLWIAFIVVATFGSIYPFNFQLPDPERATMLAFLMTCCHMPGRGDLLANAILFVPYGFTGMFAVRRDRSPGRRFWFVCWTGAAIALALQLAQFYLPSRDENLQDVVWNTVGASFGAGLAVLARRLLSTHQDSTANVSTVPLALAATWVLYRLIPFVPSLDFQLIKDSLKPLFSFQLSFVSVAHDLVAWLVVAYLLRNATPSTRLDGYLPALVAGVFGLEIIILANALTASNVLGALLAIGLWWGVLGRSRGQEVTLVLLLFFVLAVAGLAPFVARTEPIAFNWLPFHGFLRGSMTVNAQSAVEKTFLFGSLVYLIWRMHVSWSASILATASFVALVEYAQTHLVGHTPEITDPLLVIFAALAVVSLERQERRAAAAKSGHGKRTGRLHAGSGESFARRGGNRAGWMTERVNLRADQYATLLRLAEQSRCSVSAVVRRIVAQFIDELARETGQPDSGDHSMSAAQAKPATTPESAVLPTQWVAEDINFRPDQHDFLEQLAQAMGISVSRATRRIISQSRALSTDAVRQRDP